MAVSVIGVLAGCTAGTDERGELEGDAGGVGSTQTAIQVAQVTDVHEETGGTLLEGPTFAADGRLFVVDVMAPPGAPKVITVDTETGDINSVYTDHESGFTSAQFGPHDNRLYLTDIASGAILSIRPDGTDPRTEFSGEVEGSLMLADDLAFDEQGAMYVTDTRGMLSPGWEAHGRVVRIAPDRTATVLAKDLPSPNGIAFDETGEGLWVAQYNANRIDYYALSDDHTTVEAAYPAVHVSAGRGRVDSTAVDSEGNIYQAFHGLPQIRVFSPAGDLLQIIHAPGAGLESATNIAIRPGSTDGYLTVSGPAGGFIYSFQAAAEGGRQSNGG